MKMSPKIFRSEPISDHFENLTLTFHSDKLLDLHRIHIGMVDKMIHFGHHLHFEILARFRPKNRCFRRIQDPPRVIVQIELPFASEYPFFGRSNGNIFFLNGFQLRWLKIKGNDAAFLISITLFSYYLK